MKCVHASACPPCLCCMWMSLLLNWAGGAPAVRGGHLGGSVLFNIFFYPAKIRSWGHPVPRGGVCCSMQGFVLWGWWLTGVGRGAMTPSPPLSPTVVPEMPSAGGVPVRLPSLRNHPEELRCCCSPSSSSPPFPARGCGAGPVCMSFFLPAKEPAPGNVPPALGP